MAPMKVKEGYVTKTIRFIAMLNFGMEQLKVKTGRSQTALFNEAVEQYLEREAKKHVM